MLRVTGTLWLLGGMLVLGCRKDCSQAARMGDFEYMQGNYANAVRQYERALRADADCGVSPERLAAARRKLAAGK